MTIYVSHAPADRDAAESLERFLERRGHFVEGDDGETALRPVSAADVVILLHSKDFVFSPWRLRMEQRALDAWAEGRLILVKLDHGFAPVGLRDLPFVDATFDAQRDPFIWGKVAQEITNKIRPRPPAPDSGGETGPNDHFGAPGDGAPPVARRAPAPQAPPAQKRARGGLGPSVLLACAIVLGLAAPLLFVALSQSGAVPATVWTATGAAGLAALAALIIALAARGPRRAASEPAKKETAQAAPEEVGAPAPQASAPAPAAPPAEGVFVSYARANAPMVLPVCEEVKKAGKKLWMDKDGIGAGDNWAGEIVRAIRGSQDVMVMCSTAAFESDHVKREIYLADRYKKRLLPVFIEEAQPPEDFEYFFAGVQWLKLHETPEAERSAAVLRVLGAPS